MISGNPAKREQVFRRLLSKGLWKASNTSYRASTTYIPTIITNSGIIALVPQGRQSATLELIEEIRSREFIEYADDQNRLNNDNMLQEHLHAGLQGSPRLLLLHELLQLFGTRLVLVFDLHGLSPLLAGAQSVSEQIQHRLVGLLTRCYCRKPIVVKSMPDIRAATQKKRVCKAFPRLRGLSRAMQRIGTSSAVCSHWAHRSWTCYVCNFHMMLRASPAPKP